RDLYPLSGITDCLRLSVGYQMANEDSWANGVLWVAVRLDDQPRRFAEPRGTSRLARFCEPPLNRLHGSDAASTFVWGGQTEVDPCNGVKVAPARGGRARRTADHSGLAHGPGPS